MDRSRPLTAYDWELFDNAQLILADLDGCLISGSTVLAGVDELFARYRHKLAVVSNNSEDIGVTLSARLAGLGLALPAEHAFLAGERAVRQLAHEKPQTSVVIYGSQTLKQFAVSCDLAVCRADENPQHVLLARDTTFTFTDLADMMALVTAGTPVWVTNPDPSHPRPDGVPVPETGALWAAVASATGTTPERIIGKPAPLLLTRALEQFEVSAADAVMIGDTAATDGAAAAAAAIRFMHVDQRHSTNR
ncbi:MAG: HAD family hydrolase [Nitriliruptoraceae bacterium]